MVSSELSAAAVAAQLHGRPTALHALLGPLALHPALHGGRGQGGQLALPRHGHRHLLLEGGVLAGAETETGLDHLELGLPHLLACFFDFHLTPVPPTYSI